MKILHTADWHIGQSFHEHDRAEEHALFFDWLINQLSEQEIDVLLVAGDVFDRPNPSASAQRMYYDFLHKATSQNPKLQIIITAGNHDSAARLEATNPLLETMNIHVKGLVNRDVEGNIDYADLLVPIVKDGKTLAWCMAVPFLRQGDYPSAKNYGEGVIAFYAEMYKCVTQVRTPDQAIIAMGHLQATGSEVSEYDSSERTIIGGLDSVSPEAFDGEGVVYTALGHLHKAQRVSHRENVRYAGSPLPMSFAEKHYKQGATLITIEGAELTNIDRLHFDAPAKLMSIPKEPKAIEDVLAEIALLEDGEPTPLSNFVEIKVLITEPSPNNRFRVEQALKGKAIRLGGMIQINKYGKSESKPITYEELKTIDPITMAEDVFRRKYGNEMSERMKEMLQSVIREVQV